MLGKFSAALALVAAADAFKLEPVTTMAQLSADAVEEEPVVIAAPEDATPTTDVGTKDKPVAAEEEDAEAEEPAAPAVSEEVVEEETTPESVESPNPDKPAGSIHLTVSMGAAIALLVTSAF